MVLLTSPKQIRLESCAGAQIGALGEGIKWIYLDDAGLQSEGWRKAANLISDSGGHLYPFSSNWCHGSTNIS